MEGKPLGDQERPSVVSEGPNWQAGGAREILLSGFASREMHKAYVAWLESGDAHEAFGKWADEKGYA